VAGEDPSEGAVGEDVLADGVVVAGALAAEEAPLAVVATMHEAITATSAVSSERIMPAKA
jgi:hypothetical protein